MDHAEFVMVENILHPIPSQASFVTFLHHTRRETPLHQIILSYVGLKNNFADARKNFSPGILTIFLFRI